MNAAVWIIGAAGLAVLAYEKGWGALVGVCPSGTVLVQDMFPSCDSVTSTAGALQVQALAQQSACLARWRHR